MKDEQSHPYQVSLWLPSVPGSRLYEAGHWVEQARCITEERAKEVALCLSIRHKAVAVALLTDRGTQGAAFVNYAYYPDEASARAYVAEHP